MVKVGPNVPHNVPDNNKAPQAKTSSTQGLTGKTFTQLNSKEYRLPDSITNRLPTQTTTPRNLSDSVIEQRPNK